MKILIIGGCGYIGSHLYDVLGKKHQVTTVDCERSGNFSNPENIKIDSKTDELILFFFIVDKEFYCNLSKEHKDYKSVSLCDSKKIVLSPKSGRLIKHINDKVF